MARPVNLVRVVNIVEPFGHIRFRGEGLNLRGRARLPKVVMTLRNSPPAPSFPLSELFRCYREPPRWIWSRDRLL